MKHAIKVLEDARKRIGDDSHDEKKEFSRAIAILRAIGAKRLPKQVVAAQLEAVDFGPFAEYRLLWDYETEQRKDWREISLRLSPGDIVLTCRAQFAESEERRMKEKKPKPGARANGPERPWLILNVRQKMTSHHTLSGFYGPWKDTDLESGFIQRLRAAWDKPIEDLSNHDLAICLRQKLAIDEVLVIAKERIAAGFDDDSEMHDTELRDAIEETEYWCRADEEDRRIRGLPPRTKNA